MRYIAKPAIPDSEPEVIFYDKERGDVREYLEDCYNYLRLKGVDFEEYDFEDIDESAEMEICSHISDIEREIEEVDEEKVAAAMIEDLKNRVDHNEQFTGTVAREVSSLMGEISRIKKEMCTQNKLDIANGRIKSLAHILEQHSNYLGNLRKQNENETTS